MTIQWEHDQTVDITLSDQQVKVSDNDEDGDDGVDVT